MIIENNKLFKKSKEEYRDDFLIDEETISDILERKFIIETAGCQSSDCPVAVIVGAQPGAGKTGVISKSITDLNKTGNGCLVIDNDNYRLYHPRLNEINSFCPEYYTECTDQISFAMTPRMIARGIINKYNMVIHQTLKNDGIINRAIKDLKNAGYCVVIRALAVSDLNSNLSMIERCQKTILTDKTSRWVPQENHDYAYNGLPGTIGKIEQTGSYDLLEVMLREDGAVLNPTNMYRKYNPNISDKHFKELMRCGISYYELLRYPNAEIAVVEGRKLDLCDTIAKFQRKVNELETKATTAEEKERIEAVKNLYLVYTSGSHASEKDSEETKKVKQQ